MNRRPLLAAVGTAALAGRLIDASPADTTATDDPSDVEDARSTDASYTWCGRLFEAFESRLGELFQFDILEVGDGLTLFEPSADVAPCSWETES